MDAVVAADLRVERGRHQGALTDRDDPTRGRSGPDPRQHLDVVAKVSRGLGEAMVGINVDEIPQPHRLAERGW